MRFHVVTLFPEMIEQAVQIGIVGQALKAGKIAVSTLNPRVFTTNVHHTVDGRPFGGGDGMLMLAETMRQALASIKEGLPPESKTKVVHLSPRGEKLTDEKARELSGLDDLVLIASRYAGLDQRFVNLFVDEEISIGDYVLSGGELPALVVIDSVARHLPGVLGNESSASAESFGLPGGLLEEPQFTRPREWQGQEVPEALLSGNHAQIEAWKRALQILVTLDRRPELLEAISNKELESAKRVWETMTGAQRDACGFRDHGLVDQRLRERLQAATLKKG